MKGPRLDVDAICAAMLEGYEKNRLLWAAKQQQLEAAPTDMGPSTDETSRNKKKKKKKNETTKKKMKKNKNKSFKRPLDFPF